jgi:hypothetical protein
MKTASGRISSDARSMWGSKSDNAGERPYWASRKLSQTGRAPKNERADASSFFLSAMGLRSPVKPDDRSHGVGVAARGGWPAKTVKTTAPGCAARSDPHANTPSSRCGEMTRTFLNVSPGKTETRPITGGASSVSGNFWEWPVPSGGRAGVSKGSCQLSYIF